MAADMPVIWGWRQGKFRKNGNFSSAAMRVICDGLPLPCAAPAASCTTGNSAARKAKLNIRQAVCDRRGYLAASISSIFIRSSVLTSELSEIPRAAARWLR